MDVTKYIENAIKEASLTTEDLSKRLRESKRATTTNQQDLARILNSLGRLIEKYRELLQDLKESNAGDQGQGTGSLNPNM